MANTKNLNLYLTDDSEDPTFGDWRKKINGEGSDEEKSNFQKIDEAIGKVGTSYTITTPINLGAEYGTPISLNEADAQFFISAMNNGEYLKTTVILLQLDDMSYPLALDYLDLSDGSLVYKVAAGTAALEIRVALQDPTAGTVTATITAKSNSDSGMQHILTTELELQSGDPIPLNEADSAVFEEAYISEDYTKVFSVVIPGSGCATLVSVGRDDIGAFVYEYDAIITKIRIYALRIDDVWYASVQFPENDVVTLKSDVSSLQTNVSTIQKDISTLQTNTTALQTDVSTHTQQIAELQAQTEGIVWHTGIGNPNPVSGKIGDFYIDTVNGVLWRKGEDDAWANIYVFTPPVEQYTVTFNESADYHFNPGAKTEYTVTKGRCLATIPPIGIYEPPVPIWNGNDGTDREFIGWYVVEDPANITVTHDKFTNLTPVSTNLTLYAHWKQIS